MPGRSNNVAYNTTDFKGHNGFTEIPLPKYSNMKKINSVEELKKEATTKSGDYEDFFITLNYGAKSSKRILYNSETNTFDVINEIDFSYQDDLTEEQLANETLIVEAIYKGALFKYDF